MSKAYEEEGRALHGGCARALGFRMCVRIEAEQRCRHRVNTFDVSREKYVLGRLMRTPLRSLLLVTTLALQSAAFAVSSADQDKLIDALFKESDIYDVELSPDGRTLAFQTDDKGDTSLVTVDMATMKRLGHAVGPAPGQGVFFRGWADDAHLIYIIGLRNKWGREVVAANRTLTDRLRLLPDSWPVIFDTTPYAKGDVLLTQKKADGLYSDIVRLDITSPTDQQTVAGRNPGDFVGWHADLDGVVRVGYKRTDDGYYETFHRWKESEPWKKLPLPLHAFVSSFSSTGDSVLIRYPDADGRDVLQAFDLKTEQLVGQPVSDPVYDISGWPVRDSRTRQTIAYVSRADRPKYIWFDADYARLYKALRTKMPGLQHNFIGYIPSGELLIESYSDVQPTYYWLLDLKTMAGRSFKKSRPWIDPEKMHPMEPVHFTARDGAAVHGYLTRASADAKKPGPLLLYIHGRPYARDDWGFNSDVQFFSALGYSVLQVNYRGSSGFGEAYQLPTALDVARVSVDDVADAARWAIETGVADPKRIAIYGGSYGGYIALASATRYPDLYSAAIGFAGVYDWVRHYERTTDTGGSFWDWQQRRYGDAKKNPEKFRAYSPVNYAAAIKCPVWLGHGGEDETVNIDQTNAMAAALKKAGKTFELRTDPWMVHGFFEPEKRRQFYRSISDFLLKNVPVD